MGWRQWVGLVLGLSGAVIVITARSEIAAPSVAALGFAVLGLIGITGGSLWEKRYGVSHHPVTANLVGFAAGFVGVAPFMVAFERMQIDWSWQLIGALAYLIIASSLIAIGLLLAMIRAGEVSRVSALFFPGAAYGRRICLAGAGGGDAAHGMGWHGRRGIGCFSGDQKTG